jgi:predicted transglutaminase-like cysteine proteinase
MRQTALQRYGAAAAEAVDGWRAAMAGWRELPEVEQLQRVNEFFNRRIRFAEDPVVWGQPDYWATPLETLARGAATARTLSLRSTSACASWAFQTAGCA